MFILGTAAAGMLEAQEKRAAAKADAGRRVYPLNRRWLFGGKTAAGVAAADFNDAAWQPVTLPHSNVRFCRGTVSPKAQLSIRVRLPAPLSRAARNGSGKRVFLDFGGAMTASTVTVNGHKFDEYKGGYTPFSFELTPHLEVRRRQRRSRWNWTRPSAPTSRPSD
jgi:beta-galactosidase